MGADFPYGATVRELLAALEAVPEEHRDLEVNVMFCPEGSDNADGFDLPGSVRAVDPFPEAMAGFPSLDPVCYTIRAVEGSSTAAEVESLRMFKQFEDGEGGSEA